MGMESFMIEEVLQAEDNDGCGLLDENEFGKGSERMS